MAKKTFTRDELALLDVTPAVGRDPSNQRLTYPFGREMHGVGYVVATDGQRLHASACEGWSAHKRDDQPFPPPPAEQVIPWDAKRIGEFHGGALDDARAFASSRWDCKLELGPDGYQRLFCVYTKTPGKAASRIYPLGRDGVKVDWFKLDQLTHSLGIELRYLIDAVDCVGATGPIHMWGDGPLDPIALTHTPKGIRGADRLAVIMPFRV